jgi:hypothetical protein
MAVALVGVLCVAVVGFLIFMSVLSAIVRMFAGGNYGRGGYGAPPQQRWGVGFNQGWGDSYGRHHHHHHQHHGAQHHKPSGGLFGFGGGFGGHKKIGGGMHKSKAHFGGGGAKKKW